MFRSSASKHDAKSPLSTSSSCIPQPVRSLGPECARNNLSTCEKSESCFCLIVARRLLSWSRGNSQKKLSIGKSQHVTTNGRTTGTTASKNTRPSQHSATNHSYSWEKFTSATRGESAVPPSSHTKYICTEKTSRARPRHRILNFSMKQKYFYLLPSNEFVGLFWTAAKMRGLFRL